MGHAWMTRNLYEWGRVVKSHGGWHGKSFTSRFSVASTSEAI